MSRKRIDAFTPEKLTSGKFTFVNRKYTSTSSFMVNVPIVKVIFWRVFFHGKSHRSWDRLVRWFTLRDLSLLRLQLRKAVLEDAVDPNDLKSGKPGIME